MFSIDSILTTRGEPRRGDLGDLLCRLPEGRPGLSRLISLFMTKGIEVRFSSSITAGTVVLRRDWRLPRLGRLCCLDMPMGREICDALEFLRDFCPLGREIRDFW